MVEGVNTLDSIEQLYLKVESDKYKYKSGFQIGASDSVRAINEHIFKLCQVDIFKQNTVDEILLYEKTLSEYLSTYISNSLQNHDVDDELKLIRSATSIKNLEVHEIKFSPFVEDTLKTTELTVPDLKSIIHNPSSIVNIEHPRTDGIYILSSKISTRKGARIVLCVIDEIVINYSKKSLISYCIVLHYDRFKDLLYNPIQLFLKSLDFYGKTLSYNGVVKKFFFEIELIENSQEGLAKMTQQLMGEKKRDFMLNYSLYSTGVDAYIYMVYGFDKVKYLNDYKIARI
jgi:hypothetical protein